MDTTQGSMGEIVEVRRSGGELCVEWSIPRFLDLPCNGRYDSYESPRFRFYDARWHLEVYPNWKSSGDVSLFLGRDRDDAGPFTRTVVFSLGVRGSGGGVERRREEEKGEFGKGNGLSLGDTFKRSELREQKERLMPGDALTIVCVMKVPGAADRGASSCPDVPVRTGTRTRQPNAPTRTCQSLDKQGQQQSSDECVVCCTKSIDCAFNPCGHMSCCYQCALDVKKRNSHCPICRKSILSILKIYKSV